MSIFSQGSGEILDVVSLPVEVLPLNDAHSAFSIYGNLLDYPLDPTTFYTPCELDNDPFCTEIIHGYEFSDEHNFFRLHNVLDSNGDVLIQESVDYTNFDIGKILFKWDRTEDIDLDNSVSEYYQPSLYYRLELVEAGEYLDCGFDGCLDIHEVGDGSCDAENSTYDINSNPDPNLDPRPALKPEPEA